MNNQELYKKAVDTIQDLYYDRSVGIETCKENLKSLIYEIQNLIDTLE